MQINPEEEVDSEIFMTFEHRRWSFSHSWLRENYQVHQFAFIWEKKILNRRF